MRSNILLLSVLRHPFSWPADRKNTTTLFLSLMPRFSLLLLLIYSQLQNQDGDEPNSRNPNRRTLAMVWTPPTAMDTLTPPGWDGVFSSFPREAILFLFLGRDFQEAEGLISHPLRLLEAFGMREQPLDMGPSKGSSWNLHNGLFHFLSFPFPLLSPAVERCLVQDTHTPPSK